MADLTGWDLLHSELPKESLKPVPKYVYQVEGLTDVNEGFLIQRLWASKLPWSVKILKSEFLGSEERTPKKGGPPSTWYMAHVDLSLEIDGRTFEGSGAHDNLKLDAAFKGAKTVAFKAACKDAGLTTQLWMDGKQIDDINLDPNEVSGSSRTPQAPAQPPASAAPALILSDPQKAEMARLVNTLPENARQDARKGAFEAAKATAVRDPSKGFEAGRSFLVALHARHCGKSDCEHVAA